MLILVGLAKKSNNCTLARRGRGGAGLGLAIGQWIAEGHGGEIDVKKRVGKEVSF